EQRIGVGDATEETHTIGDPELGAQIADGRFETPGPGDREVPPARPKTTTRPCANADFGCLLLLEALHHDDARRLQRCCWMLGYAVVEKNGRLRDAPRYELAG